MLDQGTREVVIVNPIEAIRFYTDGVLTEDWLDETLDLVKEGDAWKVCGHSLQITM